MHAAAGLALGRPCLTTFCRFESPKACCGHSSFTKVAASGGRMAVPKETAEHPAGAQNTGSRPLRRDWNCCEQGWKQVHVGGRCSVRESVRRWDFGPRGVGAASRATATGRRLSCLLSVAGSRAKAAPLLLLLLVLALGISGRGGRLRLARLLHAQRLGNHDKRDAAHLRSGGQGGHTHVVGR